MNSMEHEFKGYEKGRHNHRIVITKSSISVSVPKVLYVCFGCRMEGALD